MGSEKVHDDFFGKNWFVPFYENLWLATLLSEIWTLYHNWNVQYYEHEVSVYE